MSFLPGLSVFARLVLHKCNRSERALSSLALETMMWIMFCYLLSLDLIAQGGILPALCKWGNPCRGLLEHTGKSSGGSWDVWKSVTSSGNLYPSLYQVVVPRDQGLCHLKHDTELKGSSHELMVKRSMNSNEMLLLFQLSVNRNFTVSTAKLKLLAFHPL